VPMILGIFGYFAVDKGWAGAALAGGLAEALACGVVASLVYRKPVVTSGPIA
jgi:Na+-driven multidrug efflux pump